MMFINFLLATVLSASVAEPTSDRALPADVSSRVGLYLLVTAACDQMIDTHAALTAEKTSATLLQSYGYTNEEIKLMFQGFIKSNLDYYIDSVRQASGNNVTAIRYFCSSTIKKKHDEVEEIKARNLP